MKKHLGAGIAVCALAIVGVGGPVSGAAAAEKVTYLLPAPSFLMAFGPWQVAKAKGYYKAEGLEVHADSGINSISDLKGKTITTMSYQDTTYYALLGMMASVGLKKSDANIQAAGPVNTWKLFLAGKSQAMAAVPDWLGIAYGAKMKVKVFPADDHFQSMAQAILASDKTIRERPQLIAKLVRATLRGMKDIMANPKAAAYVTAVPRWKGKMGAVIGTFGLYNKYVYPGQKVVGRMDEGRLAKLQGFYKSQGFIRRTVPVKDLYTNQFVK
ncbi:MAG: ABC transporter substrate-binding protein [Alphaproteobacteria bacterium]